MKRIFVTGTAGFIGYHLAELLLREGFAVHGYDGLTDHYDVQLKRSRHQRLLGTPGFTATEAMLEDFDTLHKAVCDFRPDAIVHLAAQAGVRFSLVEPRAYVDSNVVGTFNVLELARELGTNHLLIASTSSVYGANTRMPSRETDQADTQLSIYAATKKACESMAHSYAHLFGIPTTAIRFFTIYGPWSRPDLALFRFVDAILDGRPIEIYNEGDMSRDFTFVTDAVRSVRLLIETPPPSPGTRYAGIPNDSLSDVAPYRTVNVGNNDPTRLPDFIRIIEEELGRTAEKTYLPMKPGDVAETWADCGLLSSLTGYLPETSVRDGVGEFVRWFREYYRK